MFVGCYCLLDDADAVHDEIWTPIIDCVLDRLQVLRANVRIEGNCPNRIAENGFQLAPSDRSGNIELGAQLPKQRMSEHATGTDDTHPHYVLRVSPPPRKR